ncbi:ferrochelatase [Coxiella endosymbiont of Ornithodoros amblus]|uniref:ferrochelatase n=1 Tax=Coxiella endosymbiont of Ornithodoros amblus TaxID=1656166 RepID=UPI00244DC079|nr:ferrochelatase [Coxiella endosymbiont of Ornithodoros amblus]
MINLGTPDEPSVPAVRRYLRYFSDPKVIDVPSLVRWVIVHLYILPFHPKRSGRLYQKIWMLEGSPLLVYSAMLREHAEEALSDDFCGSWHALW